MKNSVETILQDIKKLFKELEVAYGDIKPQLCEVNSAADSCPNKNCWVNRSRNEYFDRICELERGISETLEIINATNTPSYAEIDIKNKLSKLIKHEARIENEDIPKVAIQF